MLGTVSEGFGAKSFEIQVFPSQIAYMFISFEKDIFYRALK